MLLAVDDVEARDNSWRFDALCRDRDPELWDLEWLRHNGIGKHNRTRLEQYARRTCAGCRVLVECAEAAYRDRDCYMIRAGIPIRWDSYREDRAKLKAIFDPEESEPDPPSEIQRRRWADRRCRQCGFHLRPQRSYRGHWPGTKASSGSDMCQSCWKRIRKAG